MDIIEILERRFRLTGEIGVYMLLRALRDTEDGIDTDAGDSPQES